MDFENGNVKLKLKENTLHAHIFGEIDHHSARLVREAIDASLISHSPDALVLDLSEISFMDSSGLGLVMGRYTKACEAGIKFSVCGATPRTVKMFDMAGLDRIIDYKEDKK